MESIERCDDDTLLKSLIELGESCPKLLRPQLDQVNLKYDVPKTLVESIFKLLLSFFL